MIASLNLLFLAELLIVCLVYIDLQYSGMKRSEPVGITAPCIVNWISETPYSTKAISVIRDRFKGLKQLILFYAANHIATLFK